MKKQIEEVQRYFVNKITACEFDEYQIKDSYDGWFGFKVTIDGYEFKFSVKPDLEICTTAFGFMELSLPNDRLKNLIEFISSESERIKAEKIEKLKKELEQLQS